MSRRASARSSRLRGPRCSLPLLLLLCAPPATAATALSPAARVAPAKVPKRPPFEASFRRPTDYLWILLGAAAGFVMHESGHVVMDLSFGKVPRFVPVKLGPFPFFAIEPQGLRGGQERYFIAAAGFLTQDLWSELIFGFVPRLRERDRPLLKGLLGFHIVLSLGYAITAFAGIGPPQSDVNSMARGLGVPSWAIGTLLAVPAVCDLYRYLVPDSRWAPYVSIGGKLGTAGIAFAF